MVDRVKTGIPGFDKLVEGGLPKGFNILVAGAPGTGKTIFGLQYLYTGVLAGEPGVYISLDSSDGTVRLQAKQLGWDIPKLEKQGKLCILDVPQDKSKVNLFELIEEGVKEVGAKRLVFDSLAAFAINMDQFAIEVGSTDMISVDSKGLKGLQSNRQMITGPRNFYSGTSEKRITFLVMNELLRLGTTNVVITDSKHDEITSDGVSEYVCDGLVSLKSLTVGETLSRTIEVKKMRCTAIDGGIKSYEIGSKGLTLV